MKLIKQVCYDCFNFLLREGRGVGIKLKNDRVLASQNIMMKFDIDKFNIDKTSLL